MTVIHRRPNAPTGQAPAITAIFVTFSVLILYLLATVTDDAPTQTNIPSGMKSSLRHSVVKKRQQLKSALHSLTTNHMPMRLLKLRENNDIVGEHLGEIRAGTETVEEVLHGQSLSIVRSDLAKPPMEISEVIDYLTGWIHTLHETLATKKQESHVGIWNAYHDLAVKTLYLWDREYLERMPERRDDGSLYLSIATYRDENCYNTVKNAFGKSKNPDKLFVGIVQQNCHSDCKSGILDASGKTEAVEPDQDCFKVFCESAEGKSLCEKGNVRLLDVDEPESLGPYAARYFASKMWNGENWFMQIDAHMTFIQDWDAISIAMLKNAPSEKPVLSHYPPSNTMDLEKEASNPGSRLCGPAFATSDLESQVVRLEGSSNYDKVKLPTPRFAPFTAAGYFVAHADFLREVPFDPFLPWIFMGEEIIMSTRLWTAGYDIFSPTQNVVGHIYVRRHKPKFWESVHRAFTYGVHTPLQQMVLNRIKYQLGYPEAAKDMLKPKNLLTAVEQYSMGTERPLEKYLELVGLNVTTKEITRTGWCEEGHPPPGFEEFADRYTEKN